MPSIADTHDRLGVEPGGHADLLAGELAARRPRSTVRTRRPTASVSAAVTMRVAGGDAVELRRCAPNSASAGAGQGHRPRSAGRARRCGRPPRARCTSRGSRGPPPPTDSGSAMPTRPASASAAHRSRSKPSLVGDDLLRALERRGVGQDLGRELAEVLLVGGEGEVHQRLSPREAQPEHGDQVALHLVGAAAEGEDDRARGARARAATRSTAPGASGFEVRRPGRGSP